MSPRDLRVRLGDVLSPIEAIFPYMEGMSETDFFADQLRIDAVIRNVEIIGEAAANIPEEIREKHSDVPWQDMKRIRNGVAHISFGIDLVAMWKTIQHDLPPLVPQLRAILHNLDT